MEIMESLLLNIYRTNHSNFIFRKINSFFFKNYGDVVRKNGGALREGPILLKCSTVVAGS